jgi:hypothetical protein
MFIYHWKSMEGWVGTKGRTYSKHTLSVNLQTNTIYFYKKEIIHSVNILMVNSVHRDISRTLGYIYNRVQ